MLIVSVILFRIGERDKLYQRWNSGTYHKMKFNDAGACDGVTIMVPVPVNAAGDRAESNTGAAQAA